ncbi:hemin uptake protein HemP [Luteimonas pelagia]
MRQEGCDVPADEARPSPRPPACESSELLRGAREVLIRHGGEVYRLRHTRNDKLILTK